LGFVLLGGEIVGAAKELEIVAGAILAHLVYQLDEAQINGAPRRDANRRFARRFHLFHCNPAPAAPASLCVVRRSGMIAWRILEG
jgi:hypothetical protein